MCKENDQDASSNNQDSRGRSIRKSLKSDSCPSFAWYCYVLLVQECLSLNCVPWTARSNHRHARLFWSSKRLWGILLNLSCFHTTLTEYPILKKGAPTALTGLEDFAVKEYIERFDSSLFRILLCAQWPQRNVWFKYCMYCMCGLQCIHCMDGVYVWMRACMTV